MGQEHTKPPVLDYETPASPSKVSGWAIASITCGILPFISVLALCAMGENVILIICMPTAAAGALLLGLKSMKAHPRSTEKQFAKTGIILGIIVLLGICGIAVILPQLGRARGVANRANCANNLKQIGTAILQYANANNNQFPPNLDVLMHTQGLTPKRFICPASKDAQLPNLSLGLQGHLSYVYLCPTTTADKIEPNIVIAYEPLTNHGDGINILFGDFHVEWCTTKEEIVAELMKSKNLPPSSP